MGELITAVLVFGTAAAAWTFVLRGTEHVWFPRTLRRLDRLLLRCDPRTAAPAPTCRPLEEIAADVRRLARRHRCPAEGARFAKVEGYRRAYDNVLLEACSVLSVTTLIGVLPPGTELDRERMRVEELLDTAGLSVEVWR